jgi:hypothetical protein
MHFVRDQANPLSRLTSEWQVPHIPLSNKADKQNFEDFGALQNSVSYFWKVAAPCTAAFFVIFSFSYIQYGFSTIMRRFDRWRRTREVAEKLGVERKERRRRKSVW